MTGHAIIGGGIAMNPATPKPCRLCAGRQDIYDWMLGAPVVCVGGHTPEEYAAHAERMRADEEEVAEADSAATRWSLPARREPVQ